MYYNTRGGGKKLTKAAEKYIRISKAIINKTIEEQRWLKQDKKTWHYIDMVFYMPDRRVRDSHNMLKLLLDVMQGVVYHNDYYVLPRIQSVEYDKENPCVSLCITAQSKLKREKGLQMVK
jgi:crossover junction endodeoxyribonuclease RusA